MAVKSRCVAVNRKRYLVDLETCEVVNESPVCLEVRCESKPAGDREERNCGDSGCPYAPGGQGRGDSWRVLTIGVPVQLLEALDRLVPERDWSSREPPGPGGAGEVPVPPRGLTDVSKALAEMRGLYALRGFAMAVRYLLDLARINDDLNEFNRRLSLW